MLKLPNFCSVLYGRSLAGFNRTTLKVGHCGARCVTLETYQNFLTGQSGSLNYFSAVYFIQTADLSCLYILKVYEHVHRFTVSSIPVLKGEAFVYLWLFLFFARCTNVLLE